MFTVKLGSRERKQRPSLSDLLFPEPRGQGQTPSASQGRNILRTRPGDY